MELGNLSIRLGIDSTVKQQLDMMQKELDAFKQKNHQTILKISAQLDDKISADKIKAKVENSLKNVNVGGKFNKAAFQKALDGYKFNVAINPYVKSGKGSPKINVDAVVNSKVLLDSVRAALAGQTFSIRTVAKAPNSPKAGFDTNNAGSYHSKLTGIEESLTRIRRLMLSINTVWSTTSVFSNIVQIGGALQQQDVALKTLLGSERRQLVLSKQITDMALKSPLSLQQTYAGVKQLAAYGIQYEELWKTIKNLGNIAAGTGVSLDRLTLAYGQVAARGILQGQELRQFTEAGVNLPTALADYYSKLEGKMVTVADVQDRISRRMVSFQDVSNVINDMAGGTGRFANQMEKQADTMLGVWSNLGDKVQLMYKGILENNDGTFRFILDTITALIEAWRVWVPLLKGGLEVFLAYKALSSIPVLLLSIKSAFTGLAGSLAGIFQGSKAFTSGMKESAAALQNMGISAKYANVAVKGLAVLNIAAIIAGIAVALWELYRARTAETREMEKVTDETQRHKRQQEQLKETSTELISKFTSLSEQYKAVGKNMKAQKQFIEDNQSAFEELGLRINDVNDANRILIERAPDVIKALTLMSQARVFTKALDESTSTEIKAHGNFIKYKAIAEKLQKRQPLTDEEKKMIDTSYWGTAQVGYTYLSPQRYKYAYARAKHARNSSEMVDILNAYANMFFNIDQSNGALGAQYEASRSIAKSMKAYNAIMDPLNGKAEELSNRLPGNGNGKGNNKGEDVKLKALKEWFDREKDFLSTYEKLAELYGKEDALRRTIEAYGNPFIELDEKGNAKRDKAGKIIPANLTAESLNRVAQKNTQYRYDYWVKKSLGTTPERRSTMRDLNKFANEELQIKIDTTEFESQSEKVSKWLDKLTKQYEEFRAIAEKTGDEGLASRLVFGEDGVTQAKEYYDILSKLSGILKTLGIQKPIRSLIDMSDADLEDKYKGKGQLESMRNLVKRAKELDLERVKDENESLSEMLANNKSYADKVSAIYAKEQRLLRIINKDSMKEHPALTNEQANRAIDTVKKNADQERADLMFNEFKSSPYYSQMFDNLDSMGMEALVNLRRQLMAIGDETKKSFSPEQLKAWQEAVNKVSVSLYKENPNAAIKEALQEVKDSGILGEWGKGIDTSGGIFKSIRTANEVNVRLQEKLNSLRRKGNELLIEERGLNKELNTATSDRSIIQQKLNSAYEKAADKLMKNNGNGTWTDKSGNTYDKTQLPELTVIANSADVQELKVKLVENQEKINDIEKRLNDNHTQQQDVNTQIGIGQSFGRNAGMQETGQFNNSVIGKFIGNGMSSFMGQAGGVVSMIDKIVKSIDDTIQGLKQLADEIAEVMDAWGKDTSIDSGIGKFQELMGMMSKMSTHVKSSWESFKSGDAMGAVTHAVGAVTSIFTGIAQWHDKKLDKKIQDSQFRVKKLQQAYEELLSLLNRQLGSATGEQLNKMTESLQSQLSELEGQRANEEKKKKTDKEKMLDYDKQIAETREQLRYLREDYAKDTYGIDLKQWAADLGDALVEAWQKGENAADAFHKKASSILADVAKNVLVKGLMEKAMKNMQTALFGANGDGGMFADGQIDASEFGTLSKMFMDLAGQIPQWKDLWDKLNEAVKQESGGQIDLNKTDNDDTSLKAGIKNITEETADLLAAYLNSMRADVSVMRSMQSAWSDKINALADAFKQVNMEEMSKNATIQTTYLEQIAENSRLLLSVSTDSKDAVVAVNDLMRQVSNGAKSLTVKMK